MPRLIVIAPLAFAAVALPVGCGSDDHPSPPKNRPPRQSEVPRDRITKGAFLTNSNRAVALFMSRIVESERVVVRFSKCSAGARTVSRPDNQFNAAPGWTPFLCGVVVEGEESEGKREFNVYVDTRDLTQSTLEVTYETLLRPGEEDLPRDFD